jgi:CspA family cold shock protein
MLGVVVRKSEKGFAFLEPSDGGHNIFMHASSLPRGEFDALTDGDAVEFDIEFDEQRGSNRAINCRRVDGGDQE